MSLQWSLNTGLEPKRVETETGSYSFIGFVLSWKKKCDERSAVTNWHEVVKKFDLSGLTGTGWSCFTVSFTGVGKIYTLGQLIIPRSLVQEVLRALLY